MGCLYSLNATSRKYAPFIATSHTNTCSQAQNLSVQYKQAFLKLFLGMTPQNQGLTK